MRAKALIVLLILAFGMVQYTYSQQIQEYEEKLSLLVVGNYMYWKLELGWFNKALPEIESVLSEFPDINEFKLIAIKAKEWDTNAELVKLFDFLPTDNIPKEGVILISKNNMFISRLGEKLGLIFQPFETMYYSHVIFKPFINDKLWELVPTNLGGFSNVIKKDEFTDQNFAFFVLECKKFEGKILSKVTLISRKQDVIKENVFQLKNLFEDIEGKNTSSYATKSIVTLKALGALMSTKVGKLENNINNFTSYFEYRLRVGEQIPNFNITITRFYPLLIAERIVSKSCVSKGETLEVVIKVRNAGKPESPPIENITINEVWWKPYFEKIAGHTEIKIDSLKPGEEKEIPYEIRVITDEKRLIVQGVENNVVTYSFTMGGIKVTQMAYLNDVHITLNDENAGIVVRIRPEESLQSVGPMIKVKVVVENIGKKAAYNIKLYQNGEEIADVGDLVTGLNWTKVLKLRIKEDNWFRANITIYSKWESAGKSFGSYSNIVTTYLTSFAPLLPVINIEKSTDLERDKLSGNVTITLKNTLNETLKVTVEENLPKVLEWKNGSILPKDGNKLVKEVEIKGLENVTLSYAFISKASENLILPPTIAKVNWYNRTYVFLGKSEIIPFGIELEKFVKPTKGFVGMNVTLISRLTNIGSLPLTKVRLEDNIQKGMVIVNGSSVNEKDILKKGESINTKLTVTILKEGNYTIGGVNAKFRISWEDVTLTSKRLNATYYEPIYAKVELESNKLVENKPFEIIIKVFNPTNVTVSNVKFSLELPPILSLVEGNLENSWSRLEAGKMVSVKAKVVASLGEKVKLENATLTFTYLNQTLNGRFYPKEITITDDLMLRYGYPMLVALLIIAGTTFAVKRLSRKEK